MISSNSPIPPNGGDRQRTALLLRALQSFANVDLLLYRALARTEPAMLSALEKEQEFQFVGRIEPTPRGSFGAWRLLRPLAPYLVDRLAHNLSLAHNSWPEDPVLTKALQKVSSNTSYDAIVYRYLPAALAAPPPAGVPGLVDVDDVPTQVYQQRLSNEPLGKFKRWVIERHVKALEARLPDRLTKFAHVWVANPNDVVNMPHPTASSLPNIPYLGVNTPLPPLPPNQEDRQIGFIGTLDYDVNITGIDFFIQQVWPRILQAQPGAKFLLYGMGASDRNKARWRRVPGVEVVGFVENIRNAYEQCAFTVVPLLTGGGSKIKVPESLAYGRTCVVTPHSLRGFEHALQHDDSLLVAEQPHAIANQCLQLLNDRQLRDRLADRGYAQVCEHFSFNTVRRIVEASCTRAINSTD